MVKTNQDGPWVFHGTVLRFTPSPFKKKRDEFRDGCRRVSCALDKLPVLDETTQVRLGHYSCSRYGNKQCHRAAEIAALSNRFGGTPSRMKTHRQGQGFHDAVVCARCSVRISSATTSFERRRDKQEQDLVLDGDVLVVANEGRLPSEISNSNQRGRRTLAFVRSIRFEDDVFRQSFPAIPEELMKECLAKDDTGVPALNRKVGAFWKEMAVLKNRGFIPPAKTAARAITYVCRSEAYDYVTRKYPNLRPKQQLQISIPIKRTLCRLARELRLVYGLGEE